MTCSVLKEDYENNKLVYSVFSPPVKAQTGKIVNSYEMYYSEDYSEHYYVMEFEIERTYSDVKDLKQKIKSDDWHKDPHEAEKMLAREKMLENFCHLEILDTPSEMDIEHHIGKNAMQNLAQIRNRLEKVTDVEFVLERYAHGWVYRVLGKSKLICLLSFQRNGFKVQISSLKMRTKKNVAKYNELSAEGKKRWEKGDDGKIIVYRVENEKHLKDVLIFISMKINKEILP